MLSTLASNIRQRLPHSSSSMTPISAIASRHFRGRGRVLFRNRELAALRNNREFDAAANFNLNNIGGPGNVRFISTSNPNRYYDPALGRMMNSSVTSSTVTSSLPPASRFIDAVRTKRSSGSGLGGSSDTTTSSNSKSDANYQMHISTLEDFLQSQNAQNDASKKEIIRNILQQVQTGPELFKQDIKNLYESIRNSSPENLKNLPSFSVLLAKIPKGFESFYKKGSDSKGEESTGGEPEKNNDNDDDPDKKKDSDKKESEKNDDSSSDKNEEKDKKKEGSGNSDNQRNQVIAAGLAVGSLLWMLNSDPPTPEITFQELVNDFLRFGYVERLQVVNKEFCRVLIRNDVTLPQTLQQRISGQTNLSRGGNNVAGGGESMTNSGSIASGSSSSGNQSQQQPREFIVQLGSPDSFESKIEASQINLGIHPQDFIPIQYTTERDIWDDFLRLLPSLLLLIPLGLALRGLYGSGGFPGAGSGGGGGGGGRNMFSLGKAFPAGKGDVKSNIKFKDVAGLHQAKIEVTEFVDFLKNPKKYEHLGAQIPKGGLLVGPPGTGKTLLAKAVAGEADRPFFSMSGSDFIEMFVGVGPSRVRDLFAQAREKAPSIVFIDEIDAVGRKRGKGGFSGGANDERENTLNQLLVEMDGFSSGTGVVVLAGTNRADILDPALTRAGRFDRQIAIDKPDIREREDIFMVHLKPVKLEKSLESSEVAKRMAALTPGFAGSEIKNICNEAAIQAARRNSKDGVNLKDFEKATERTIGGLEKSNNLMSLKEKSIVAKHESGHAIVGWFLEYADPLLKVSIVPRSNGALGFAQYLPEDISLYSKEALLDRIAVTLGGRAAEELFIGSITTGASDDLKKVTSMAYNIVTTFGMNEKVGLVNFSSDQETTFNKPYSEKTAELIDSEVQIIINEQYERVKNMLKEKEYLIEAMSEKLFEKETLVYNDIVKILGPRPYGMNKNYEKFVTATADKEFKAEDTAETSETKTSESDSASSDGTTSASKEESSEQVSASPVLNTTGNTNISAASESTTTVSASASTATTTEEFLNQANSVAETSIPENEKLKSTEDEKLSADSGTATVTDAKSTTSASASGTKVTSTSSVE